MRRSKRIQIIMLIINTLFYIAIGAYSMVTIIGGMYFKKMISNYGLITTFKMGKNWLTYGSIVLVIFSIFYLAQIILISVNYRNLSVRNAKMEEELEAMKESQGNSKKGGN